MNLSCQGSLKKFTGKHRLLLKASSLEVLVNLKPSLFRLLTNFSNSSKLDPPLSLHLIFISMKRNKIQ